MNRLKTYDSTGVAPSGILFSGDLNALQDAVAALSDFGQTIKLNILQVGDSSIQLLKYGTAEARISAALRTDGVLRGLGGLVAGAFTTTQRDAISSPPYGLVILNTSTNRYEYNAAPSGAASWQPIGNQLTSGVDVLANRPLANSVVVGSTFFATDQVVDYVSSGSSWVRKGIPAGSTLEWHSPASVPAGWTAYDGSNLPASTGIYVDIYAHLGSTLVKPDTRGRVTVGQGTHTDVDVIGDNDGLATVSTRTPLHKSTSALTVNGHTHDQGTLQGHIDDPAIHDGNTGPAATAWASSAAGAAQFQNPTTVTVNGNTGNTAPGMAGYIGPDNTTRPTDRVPWTTALKIAKL